MLNGLKKWLKEREKTHNAWRMRNYKESVTYHFEDIGMLRFWLGIMALSVVALAVLGVIWIARWIIVGV